MAQKTQLVDDLTGDVAHETVLFAIDGAHYEIDLTTDNAKMLREALDLYVQGGRKSGAVHQVKVKGGKQRVRTGGAADTETAKIRAWAKENGHEVGDRGRIPAPARAAYEAASRV